MTALHLPLTLSGLTKPHTGFTQEKMPSPHSNRTFVAIYLIVFGILSLLTGCSGMRIVESDVTAFSALASTPTGATYRFERLPSQQVDTAQQDRIERYAQSALDQLGLQRVGDAPGSASATFSVQMQHSLQRFDSAPWNAPGPKVSGFVVIGHSGSFGYPYGHPFDQPFGMMGPLWPGPYGVYAQPYYVREVSLVLRSMANAQIVYETRAQHEGRWADDESVLTAMFAAALQGFPTPPSGTRRVALPVAQ
jgi:hypothetical protein